MRALAQRLLAVEAALQSESGPQGYEAVRACEKLRLALSRMAGPDGFAALLRRAVALAREDDPLLATVRLRPDECMKDLDKLAADAREAGTGAAVTIIAYLLDLLVTFIGEPLTLRLVRDAWPDVDLGPGD